MTSVRRSGGAPKTPRGAEGAAYSSRRLPGLCDGARAMCRNVKSDRCQIELICYDSRRTGSPGKYQYPA